MLNDYNIFDLPTQALFCVLKKCGPALPQLNQLFRGRDVFDDLGGERTDADVAEVRERGSVGEFDDGLHHERDVALGVGGKVVERAHAGDVFRPARERFVHRNEGLA